MQWTAGRAAVYSTATALTDSARRQSATMAEPAAAEATESTNGQSIAVVTVGMALATIGITFSGELPSVALYAVLGLGVVLMLVGVSKLPE